MERKGSRGGFFEVAHQQDESCEKKDHQQHVVAPRDPGHRLGEHRVKGKEQRKQEGVGRGDPDLFQEEE